MLPVTNGVAGVPLCGCIPSPAKMNGFSGLAVHMYSSLEVEGPPQRPKAVDKWPFSADLPSLA